MIKVIETVLGMEFEYPSVEEFVWDLMSDDFLEDTLTNEYEYINLPCEAGEVGYGAIIREFASEYDWKRIKSEYVNYFTDEIEDNLYDGETYEFYGYLIREEI